MSHRSLRAVVASFAVLAATVLVPTTAANAATSPNLIKNPGADAAAGSTDGSVVTVPNWRPPAASKFTAVQYGAAGGFPTVADPGPPNRGANFFAGGPGAAVSKASQVVSLQAYATSINAGTARFTVLGYFGGFGSQEDAAALTVAWIDAGGATISTVTIGGVTAADRADVTGLLKRSARGSVPVGAARAKLTLTMTRNAGTYNDGYADALSLRLSTP